MLACWSNDFLKLLIWNSESRFHIFSFPPFIVSIIPSSCHHIFAIAPHKFHCTIYWEELFWVLHYSHKNTFARESAVILQLPKLSRESNKTTPNSTMTDWLNLNYGNTFITTRFIYLNMERIFLKIYLFIHERQTERERLRHRQRRCRLLTGSPMRDSIPEPRITPWATDRHPTTEPPRHSRIFF